MYNSLGLLVNRRHCETAVVIIQVTHVVATFRQLSCLRGECTSMEACYTRLTVSPIVRQTPKYSDMVDRNNGDI